MIYSVEWTEDTLAVLAVLWMQASDRQAVTAAQAAIDRLLATDPHGAASAVSEGLYALEVPPLKVHFEISQAQNAVTVVSVRRIP
jgi:hypothetical protein